MRRVLAVILATGLVSACCDPRATTLLTYRAGDGTFYLNKRCVEEISIRDAVSPGVFLNIKRSASCSETLNKIIADNIHQELIVTFQREVLIKTKIISQIKTENGFSQSTPDKNVARAIYDFYQQ